jgi:starch phosphorylase
MKPALNIFPHLPERLIGLGEMAENLWWSWHPSARQLYKMLNRQAWKESGHNPDKMIKELPREALDAAANDPDYLRHYDLVFSKFRKEIGEEKCHILDTTVHSSAPLIAYFSAV